MISINNQRIAAEIYKELLFMFFKKKKSILPTLSLFRKTDALYEGYLKDLPLKEEIILEKSIQFFSDPEPCHIHRSAVAPRLTEELYQKRTDTAELLRLLNAWASCAPVDRFVLISSENQKIEGKS